MKTSICLASIVLVCGLAMSSSLADEQPTTLGSAPTAADSSASVSVDSTTAVLQTDDSKDTRSLAQRTGAIASTATSELSTSGNSATAILRMLGALCAVLALMWVVVVVAKKYLRGNSALSGAAKRMVVEETLWLGPKKQVVLLSVGSRHLVVGVTDETMSTLSEIASEELFVPASGEASKVSAPRTQTAQTANSFDRLLAQAGGRLQHLLKRTAPIQ